MANPAAIQTAKTGRFGDIGGLRSRAKQPRVGRQRHPPRLIPIRARQPQPVHRMGLGGPGASGDDQLRRPRLVLAGPRFCRVACGVHLAHAERALCTGGPCRPDLRIHGQRRLSDRCRVDPGAPLDIPRAALVRFGAGAMGIANRTRVAVHHACPIPTGMVRRSWNKAGMEPGLPGARASCLDCTQ